MVWAAFFNFVAAFVVGVSVAKTIGKGMIDPECVDPHVILAALLGAIVWNLITWYGGLRRARRTRSSAGSAARRSPRRGSAACWRPGWSRPPSSSCSRRCSGWRSRSVLMVAVLWTFRSASPGRVDRVFRRLQLVSAALYSLGHGGNDAQKTMGIIVGLLVRPRATSGPEFHRRRSWVDPGPRHAAIGLGTLSGGWRIVKTMGMRITKLRPVGGFCAETAGALILIGTAAGGHPGQHHPHDHRRHRRRGRDEAPLGGAVGRGGADRLGLDPHDPGGGVSPR